MKYGKFQLFRMTGVFLALGTLRLIESYYTGPKGAIS